MRYAVFSKSTCSLLNISNIGYAADVSVTHFGPGVRNFYIIHYVLSGKGYFNGNCVSPGQGFLVIPGMQEHYFPDTKDPWAFLWVVSDDPALGKLFPLLDADRRTNIFHYDYVNAAREFSSFLIANNHSIYNAFEMLEIFLKLFKHQQKQDSPHIVKTNAQVYIEAADKYISSNMHRPISVSELTDFLGVSQPYLFKIFKERFLKSPKQYILELKLIRAQTLLKETDLSVTYIANSVGFQDVLSFSKWFKLKKGISPQNYRKDHKQEA